jgi:uncharacterized protein YkwD
MVVVIITSTLSFVPERVCSDTPDGLRQDVENQIIEVINQNRIRSHRKALMHSDVLTDVARIRSTDMAQRGYFGHRSPEGVSVFDIMQSMNIIYSKAAENLWLGPIEIEKPESQEEYYQKEIHKSWHWGG